MTATLTRRQLNERREKLARAKRAKIAGRKPARDAKYLAWIRSLPCYLCEVIAKRLAASCGVAVEKTMLTPWKVNYPWIPSQKSPTEAAHVGERGLRQK